MTVLPYRNTNKRLLEMTIVYICQSGHDHRLMTESRDLLSKQIDKIVYLKFRDSEKEFLSVYHLIDNDRQMQFFTQSKEQFVCL